MSLSSSTTNLTPSVVDYGLVSGLNTQSIIQAELQPYQQPITNLQTEQSTLNSNVSDYQQINSDVTAMMTAAGQLAAPSGWNAMSATSSNSTVATATAAAGTPAGTIQFSVLQLAAANSLVSSGFAASTSQIVTSRPDFLVSQGGAQLGFSTLGSGSGLTLGSHTISVTQSSEAAAVTGSAPAASTTITTGSNDQLDLNVDGTAYSLTLAASPSGRYTSSGLLSALQSAIGAAGASGALQAGYDSNGDLVLATVDQGSSQSLQVTGGSAAATLGLSTTATSTGTDATVSVDGTTTTLSTVTPGSQVNLDGPDGSTVSATLVGSSSQAYADSSLISVGSLTATDVSTGNGSLGDLVANVNAAGTGVTASAVQTGNNQYVLQLSSSTTGTAADLSVDTTAFQGYSLGALKTASAGQDAQIQVGGAGGYTISSGTDTFSGLLPGLSVTAQQVSSTPVTVSVSNDASAVASSVQSLVTDANTVLADLQKYAGYNAQTKTGGPLMGSAILENLTNQLLGTFASSVGTSTLGSAINAGITISNGTLSFNQSAFESAFSANPAQVQAMFTQGGTFAASSSSYRGLASLNYASNTTKPGAYDVNITQSASQAVDAGATVSSGAVSAAETLTLTMGGSTVTYTTSAGQTLNSITQGLNASFAANNMQLSAQVLDGNQVELRSDAYGSATAFNVASTGGGAGTLGLTTGAVTGTDVAGTIDGVAATGSGQFLSAPATDPTLGGLSLQVTATGITSATDLGTFTYAPGLAQTVSDVAAAMSGPVTGQITQTIKGMQQQSTQITPQINFYTNIMSQQQQVLMAQYATLESTLGTLKNQSSSLASQLAQLS